MNLPALLPVLQGQNSLRKSRPFFALKASIDVQALAVDSARREDLSNEPLLRAFKRLHSPCIAKSISPAPRCDDASREHELFELRFPILSRSQSIESICRQQCCRNTK